MNDLLPKMHGNLSQFLVGLAKEFIEQIELVHQLERGWMNRIAAKIAKEIFVFFQNKHIHAGPSQKETKHDAGRSTADDATGRLVGMRLRVHLFPGRHHCNRTMATAVNAREKASNYLRRSRAPEKVPRWTN